MSRQAHNVSVPEPLSAILLRCAAGEIPANVAIAQMAIATRSECQATEAVARMLHVLECRDDLRGAERLRRVMELWTRSPNMYATIGQVLALERAEADPHNDAIARWAEMFDRAASVSPEAGVAAYSLGDPELLSAASQEIVDWLKNGKLLSQDSIVLEIGCGIGRLLPLLAAEVSVVIATEIAPAMAAIARERCVSLDNALVVRSSGRDLVILADRSFDLVLAVDVYPYLLRSGAELVEAHFRESARVLKPGGKLVLFNYSYRGDLAADRADVERLAQTHSFAARCNGEGVFSLWDGLAFVLEQKS